MHGNVNVKQSKYQPVQQQRCSSRFKLEKLRQFVCVSSSNNNISSNECWIQISFTYSDKLEQPDIRLCRKSG
jgi:hypothetical protein